MNSVGDSVFWTGRINFGTEGVETGIEATNRSDSGKNISIRQKVDSSFHEIDVVNADVYRS